MASRPAARRPTTIGEPIDRRGHDQAAVVIGVIAEKLDPAGGTSGHGRFAAEPRGERRAGLRHEVVQWSVVRCPSLELGSSPPSVVLFECRRHHDDTATSRSRSTRRTDHGPLTIQATVDGAKVLAASRRTWALSVFSQVNSGSERPKWPPLAVLR